MSHHLITQESCFVQTKIKLELKITTETLAKLYPLIPFKIFFVSITTCFYHDSTSLGQAGIHDFSFSFTGYILNWCFFFESL